MVTSDRPAAGRRTAAVRTFLIADIRGYTRFTARHGDEAASRLARRFADVAAEGVEAWGGELVELRGDEALAVFDSARQALRCAVELQDAFADETAADPSLPLHVGIGLDAGEAVPVDDGYRGAALNLAARLCGAAAGGETLASANIVNLAGPVPGLVIGDLVDRTLKGLERPVEAALVGEAGSAGRAGGAATPAAIPGGAATPAAIPGAASPPGATSGPASPPASFPAELEPVVPLVGRVEELRWLRWHWRRARRGHGRAVVVSGPPGIGKTRLAAELATLAHADAAHVGYLPGARGIGAADLAPGVAGASLLVVDDLDAAAAPAQHAVADLAPGVADAPVLLLVIHRREAAAALLAVVDRLAPAERRLPLGPLAPDEVRAIAALYAGAAADQAPIRQLMDDSGGVPAAAHRAAAAWARTATTTRLGASAQRTETGRRDLRAAQEALTEDVASLEHISERSRRYDPDGPEAAGAAGVVICPYKGLASFEAVDADYYFGRERLIAELVAKLVGNPFLGFVGASGSGKSSALRAGLLPALAGGVLPGSARWVQVLLRPGEHPVEALRQALARALPDLPAEGLDAADPLGDAVARLAPDQGLIVAVDQFEEVFGATRDEAERSAFIDLLTTERRGVRTVVTLRADHYGHCAAYPALARIISQTHVLVGPLTPAELEAVIEAPAERVGLRVESELVRALVADAGAEPGVLPLLSTALLELWQARRGGWLTLDAYRAGGGLHGAIARRAEAAYAELDPGQAAVARSMFLRLAGPGEGEGVVRRRVALDEIGADGDPVAGRVLRTLTDARLVTTGDGYVEVAHEALLREWPRLQAWLEEDAEGRRVRLHLIGAARDWEQRGREPADLYRGARLSAALDWAAEHQVEVNATERAFLEAGRLASQREVEKERRTNRRLRGLLAAAGVLVVVAAGAGTYALTQADAARQQASLAEEQRADAESARAKSLEAARFARSRELAASAVSVLDDDPSLSKLLAVAAADLEPAGAEIETALRRSWAADRTIDRWAVPGGEPFSEVLADVAPDGRSLVAWGVGDPQRPRKIVVADLVEGGERWTYEPEWPEASVYQARFTPDGSHVVAGTNWDPDLDQSGTPPPDAFGVFIWDARTGRLVDRIDIGPCGGDVSAVADGVALVATKVLEPGKPIDCHWQDSPQNLEAVDLSTGKRTVLSTDTWFDTALSRDGRFAAFTDQSDGVRSVVVELATGRRVLELDPFAQKQRNSYVRGLSDDGSLLLYGDRPPKVIDVATGETTATLALDEGEHFGAAFGRGAAAMLSGRDATLSVWNATDGARTFSLPAAGGGLPSMTDDGRILVSYPTRGRVSLIDPRPRGDQGTIHTCLSFVPAGQLEVAQGVGAFSHECADGRTETLVFDPSDLSVISAVADTEGQDIALSADGTKLALATRSGRLVEPLKILDARTGHLLVELEGMCAFDLDFQGPREEAGPGCKAFPDTPFGLWPARLEFSPDGRFLALLEEGLVVWDARTGRLLAAIETNGYPWGMAFTPNADEVIVSTFDGDLVGYSTTTWEETRRVPIDESIDDRGRIEVAGVLPDGKTLIGMSGVGGNASGSLHWIDLDSLTVRRSIPAHDGSPKSMRLNEDGTLLVSGASDGIVRVWDTATGTMRQQFAVDGQAQGAAFLDDRRVAVTPYTGNLLAFGLDPQALLEVVRGSITRGLTPEECQRFGFDDACPTLEELRGSTP